MKQEGNKFAFAVIFQHSAVYRKYYFQVIVNMLIKKRFAIKRYNIYIFFINHLRHWYSTLFKVPSECASCFTHSGLHVIESQPFWLQVRCFYFVGFNALFSRIFVSLPLPLDACLFWPEVLVQQQTSWHCHRDSALLCSTERQCVVIDCIKWNTCTKFSGIRQEQQMKPSIFRPLSSEYLISFPSHYSNLTPCNNHATYTVGACLYQFLFSLAILMSSKNS